MATHKEARDDASPNTAQLRASIRSARTPSIDSAHEPAAASFDTDDEAAGRPATPAAIRQALAHEGRLPAEAPAAAGGARAFRLGGLWITAAVLLVAIAIWIVVS